MMTIKYYGEDGDIHIFHGEEIRTAASAGKITQLFVNEQYICPLSQLYSIN